MAWQSGDEYWTSLFWRRLSGSIPSSYTMFKIGTTYYAECNIPGGTAISPDTDADTVVQAAKAALTSGGKIFFKPGTYPGLSDINTDVNGIYFQGSGKKTTVLQFSSAGTNMFKFGTSGGSARSNCGIADLKIQNTVAYTTAILSYAHGTFLWDVEIDNQSTLTKAVQIDGGNASGFSLYGDFYATEIYNATTGISVESLGDLFVLRGVISNCTTGVDQVLGGLRSYFTNISSCTTAVKLQGNNGLIVFPITEANTTDILFHTSCQAAHVYSNLNLTVTDNAVAKTNRYQKINAAGKLVYNWQNSGTSTQNGDASTKVFNIAHGLVDTPTFYTAEPLHADSRAAHLLSVDGTNIIITFDAAPPSDTGNVKFSWNAKV